MVTFRKPKLLPFIAGFPTETFIDKIQRLYTANLKNFDLNL